MQLKFTFFSLFILLFSFLQAIAHPFTFKERPDDTVFNQNDSLYVKNLYLENIFITGNKRTKERIILRELDLKPGDEILEGNLPLLLEKEKNKIRNLNLFNTIDLIPVVTSGNHFDLHIKVTERWYVFPVPIFELADRNFNDWWTNQQRSLKHVEYGIRMNHFNLRGRMEKLKVIAQFGFTKQFALAYSIPYINKAQTTGLSINLSYAENNAVGYNSENNILKFIRAGRSLRETVNAGVSFSHRPSFYNFHYFSLNYSYRHIDDTVAYKNPNYFLNGQTTQQFLTAAYQFRRDIRDYAAYPLKGSLFIFDIIKQGLTGWEDVNQVILSADYANYIPLDRNYFLSNRITARTSYPSRQPYNIMNAMGYSQFIRGYELYVIEGQNYFLNKTSFKKQLIKGEQSLSELFNIDQLSTFPYAIYLKTFLDLGAVHNPMFYPEQAWLSNRFLIGAGVGLDIVSFYDNVMRLEYSFNGQRQHGFFLHFKADM